MITPLYKLTFFLFFGFIYLFKSYKIIKDTFLSRNLSLNNSNKNNQCVISSKNKKSYCNEDVNLYIQNDSYYLNKKLITISPGGFKGFYILGILCYIKENYKTDDLIFSGASAGAWNSLFMSYKGEPLDFVYNFLDINIRKSRTISELQYFMKYKLLSCYKLDDFDLKKIFIGVTTFKHFMPNIQIYSDFDNLEDAINCCMASSHIPLITGGISNRYKDMFSFDGGFSKYPYLNKDRILHVSFSMWDDLKNNNQNNFLKQSVKNIKKLSEFFSISKNNIIELFDNGYQDAKLHKSCFDELLEPKNDDILEF